MNNIPEKINAFNIYLSGNKLVGISEEVTLPDFEAMTSTINGSGILGEIESVTLGHFSSMEMDIPFRQIGTHMFRLANQQKSLDITLRGSIQYTDGTTQGIGFKPMRVVVRGRNKGISLGKMKQGEGTGSSIKLEVSYILIEIDRSPKVELDKLNFVFKVNGKDLLAKVRKMC